MVVLGGDLQSIYNRNRDGKRLIETSTPDLWWPSFLISICIRNPNKHIRKIEGKQEGEIGHTERKSEKNGKRERGAQDRRGKRGAHERRGEREKRKNRRGLPR